MKKVLLLTVVMGAFALGSCSKTYKCENADNPGVWTFSYNEDDYTESEMNSLEAACIFDNGDWTAQ